MIIDDLVDQYCIPRTQTQGGNITIKHVMDHPLRTILFTIEKVAGIRASHQTTRANMLYAKGCMDSTMFNWCEGLLVILKE